MRCCDGVYVMAWDPAKGCVGLSVCDPGFYFPEWDDGGRMPPTTRRGRTSRGSCPSTSGGLKARVRRITYELGPIGVATRTGTARDWQPCARARHGRRRRAGTDRRRQC